MNHYLNADDAARYLRIKRRTVYHLIQTGQLKSLQNRERGKLRFTTTDLDQYANKPK